MEYRREGGNRLGRGDKAQSSRAQKCRRGWLAGGLMSKAEPCEIKSCDGLALSLPQIPSTLNKPSSICSVTAIAVHAWAM